MPVGCKCLASSDLLQVVDGLQNADATSVSTGNRDTVVHQVWWCRHLWTVTTSYCCYVMITQICPSVLHRYGLVEMWRLVIPNSSPVKLPSVYQHSKTTSQVDSHCTYRAKMLSRKPLMYRVAQNKIPLKTICNISAISGLILKILEAA